jgi:hypothetical protein
LEEHRRRLLNESKVIEERTAQIGKEIQEIRERVVSMPEVLPEEPEQR